MLGHRSDGDSRAHSIFALADSTEGLLE